MDSAIIFDMDGTLYQTNLILEPALERLLKNYEKKDNGQALHLLKNIDK